MWWFPIQCSWQLKGSREERLFGSTQDGYIFLVIYIANITVIGVFDAVCDTNKDKRLQYLFHHISSIACYVLCLHQNRMVYYANFAGCCEVTNIFLTVLYCFQTSKYKGLFYTVNGFFLWLSFLIFRMILFPIWLWQFFSELQMPDGSR
jgi:hypothetical protein